MNLQIWIDRWVFGNRLFKQKFKVKKFEDKKRFPQFLICMYVFLYVCLCVCLSVFALETSIFNIGSWNFYTVTYMWISISQNDIFYFFHFFWELFLFFVFYYFLYFMPASQHIMKINTWNWSLGLMEYIIILIFTLYS